VGPPEPLALVSPFPYYIATGLAASASGRLVGVSNWPVGFLLVDSERPWRQTWLTPHRDVYELAISPDGKWAGTAGKEGYPGHEHVKVWDTATGHLQVEIPGASCVSFSPDGQWLGMNDRQGYRFFRTGLWTPVSRVDFKVDDRAGPGAMKMAFHPLGNIVALVDSDLATLRLVDVRTGRDLASFQGTNEAQVQALVFSPDGRLLAVSHNDQKVDLWDLSLIRRLLQELDLVAGFPDIDAGNSSGGDPPTIDRIDVRGADPAGLRLLAARQTLREAAVGLFDTGLTDTEELQQRGFLRLKLGLWYLAAVDFRAFLARNPDSELVANTLAWCLASKPGRGNADEAVRWARKAVELVPGDTDYRNTLGAALYRAGRYAEAALELERDIAASAPMIGFDWVFLAMCQQRLGQSASARIALARAEGWRPVADRLDPDHSATFHTLFEEARAVVDGPLPDLPPAVFDR